MKNQIVIVGGGTAGITVAARLRRAIPKADIAIIEPSGKHYYQPLWTLAGGGVLPKEATERDEATVIPKGVNWLQDAVTEFRPEKNALMTRNGKELSYQYLIVAPGIQIDWHKIKGLQGAIGKNGVCSNYAYKHVSSTWDSLRDFKGGNALFTMPNTPIKCGGAPQKIMYLAEHYFRKQGIRKNANVIFTTAGKSIFGIPKYRKTLERIVSERGIETRFKHNLIEILPESKEAIFEQLDSGNRVVIPYDMIHVTPPMSAPDFVKTIPLANEVGWGDVDPYTLQHKRYANVFALGDASSLPTSKTGAAVRKQAPVLVNNLLATMKNQPRTSHYDGYTSCPIVTGYGSLILAEFDYDGNPKETFPFDQSKERESMWLLKRYGLPPLYWHGMLKGLA